MADSASSFSLTVFNSSGKLTQLEHALSAVSAGATSLGIRARNGCVIATEKRMPSALADEKTLGKIEPITPRLGMLYAGMGPDFRILVKKARKIAQTYHQTYKELIPLSQLTRELAAVMQEFTQSGGVRPFGLSLLVVGVDDDAGPQLVQIDPSGSFFYWKASAIGKNMASAKTFLEKRYNDEMELEDAIHTAILTLKEGFDGKMTERNIEIGVVRTRAASAADTASAASATQGAGANDAGADRDDAELRTQPQIQSDMQREQLFRRLPPATVRDYLDEVE